MIFDIRLRGQERVARRLARGERLGRELEPAMKAAVLYTQGQVPGYPPPPSGSTYRRTGTLGRSVTSQSAPGALSRVETLGSGVVGYIGTSIRYAPYVIDRNRQAWMHRGRWWLLQDVVERAVDGIRRVLEREIDRILRG